MAQLIIGTTITLSLQRIIQCRNARIHTLNAKCVALQFIKEENTSLRDGIRRIFDKTKGFKQLMKGFKEDVTSITMDFEQQMALSTAHNMEQIQQYHKRIQALTAQNDNTKHESHLIPQTIQLQLDAANDSMEKMKETLRSQQQEMEQKESAFETLRQEYEMRIQTMEHVQQSTDTQNNENIENIKGKMDEIYSLIASQKEMQIQELLAKTDQLKETVNEYNKQRLALRQENEEQMQQLQTMKDDMEQQHTQQIQQLKDALKAKDMKTVALGAEEAEKERMQQMEYQKSIESWRNKLDAKEEEIAALNAQFVLKPREELDAAVSAKNAFKNDAKEALPVVTAAPLPNVQPAPIPALSPSKLRVVVAAPIPVTDAPIPVSVAPIPVTAAPMPKQRSSFHAELKRRLSTIAMTPPIAPPLPPPLPVLGQVTQVNENIPVPKTGIKMKPFHWKPLNKRQLAGKQSIWNELNLDDVVIESEMSDSNDDDEEKHQILKVNVDELEALFCKRKKSIKATKHQKKKNKKKVRLLERKRFDHMCIALSRLKMDNEVLRDAILAVSEEQLNLDKIQRLIPIVPTTEEQQMLKDYDNDPKHLEMAEKFVYTLRFIDNLPQRLMFWEFKIQFNVLCQHGQQRIDTLQTAHDIVHNSASFKLILQYVLVVGNFMNTGNRKTSGVNGFKLSSLLKLSDTKANDKKTSLLAFIVRSCHAKDAKALGFASEFTEHLPPAIRLDVGKIKSGIDQIGKQLKRLEVMVTEEMVKHDEEEVDMVPDDMFDIVMSEFLNESQATFDKLQSDFDVMVNLLVALGQYLGEKDDTGLIYLQILNEFGENVAIEVNKIEKKEENAARDKRMEVRRKERLKQLEENNQKRTDHSNAIKRKEVPLKRMLKRQQTMTQRMLNLVGMDDIQERRQTRHERNKLSVSQGHYRKASIKITRTKNRRCLFSDQLGQIVEELGIEDLEMNDDL
eukprot:731659_1